MNKNDQEFLVQKIRSQYTEKESTELDALRALDTKVKRPANVFAYMFGSVSAIIMGAGMSLVMTDISRSFFADSSYMLSFSVLCSCVCSRLISPSVSSWHKQDNTLMHQSPGHIQRRTPYNF